MPVEKLCDSAIVLFILIGYTTSIFNNVSNAGLPSPAKIKLRQREKQNGKIDDQNPAGDRLGLSRPLTTTLY